ncbi:MAG TPA: hypothetical protein VLD63_13125 [Anaerolineales bacterium]|nr:hypothetical protein [Anaerolineales bacterium]
MLRPTPLEELRRPHPDQASIDREAAELLLRSSGLLRTRTPASAKRGDGQILLEDVLDRRLGLRPGA